MILIDDKGVPPPPYSLSHRPGPPASRFKFCALPPNVLIQIVENTFSPSAYQDNVEAKRRTMYWLAVGLRLVNRDFYIACMHILRSTYFDAYFSLVRPPYTSDPFPLTAEPHHAEISSIQRETQVLDLFIALKTREDVWLDDSDLHLEREESFRDLFALMQPRCRLEDLLRYYGLRYGCVTLSNSSTTHAIPFSRLSISFSPRKATVYLHTPLSRSKNTLTRKTVLECSRERGEALEILAKKLARGLARYVAENSR